MTGPGIVTSPYGGVPTNPDGTPNFSTGAGSGGGTPTAGGLSIWNIPKALAGSKIWFDTGHGTSTETHTVGSGRLSPDFGVDANGHIGKSETKKSPTAYEILRSPQQIMAQFAAMSANDPAKFYAMQHALASGPWGSVNPTGAFDQNTETALGNAMLQYVKLTSTGVGMSFYDYLIKTGQRAQSLGGAGTSLGAGTGAAAPQINLADPTALRAAAQSAAQAALGQGLTANQLETFVSQFQAAQTTAQSSTGGSVTTPDLSGEAMQFAQKSNPAEYQQNQRQTFLDQLVNMFAPAQSQRPNMTPVPQA